MERMTDFITYNLEVAVLIAVFYLFYRLLLSRETFHRVNRIVLLSTAVLSFILPFCVITWHKTVLAEMPVPVEVHEAAAVTLEQSSSWQIYVVILFFIGLTGVVLHTLLSTFKVVGIIRNGTRISQEEGITLVITRKQTAPFSWMRYIVINESDYADSENRPAIILHERGHIRCHHSWDLLLCDLLTSLQWFNPVIWMLKSDLRALHEYEADAAVLQCGIDAKQYQYLLVIKAIGNSGLGYSVANSLSHSILKNRINMMLRKKSHKMNLLKALFILPVVGVTLAVQAKTQTEIEYMASEPDVQTMSIQNQPTGKLTIQAQVVDKESKKPMAGVTVLVKGTKFGTITDTEGFFTLKDVEEGAEVNLDFIDYETAVITAVETVNGSQINMIREGEAPVHNGVKINSVVKAGEAKKVNDKEITVHGNVVDEKSQPFAGVLVQIEGTKIGTVTDMDGKFTIKANPGDKLSFKYVDYNSQEFAVPIELKGDNCKVTLRLSKTVAYSEAKESGSKIDADLYVDDVKVESIDDINPDDIESMNVVKKEGERNKIYIKLKKK